MMQALAEAVARLLPQGWSVRGATLAAPGAIDAALSGLRANGPVLVYPHFMADGWFTTKELPRRLRAAGAEDFDILPALGLDPAVPDLCLRRAEAAVRAGGHAAGEVALVLAAHGSPSDPRPARVAGAVAEFLAASGRFREVIPGYVDQPPFLADAARVDAPAVCLPFFAGRAGHVEMDLPEALAEAEFPGPLLDPVGADAEVPGIIAAALEGYAAGQAE
jgi:sirohydrochlorin ferrochelatase